MLATHVLTLSEAGYVLDRSPQTIGKAVDTGTIRAQFSRDKTHAQRLLGTAELRFLVLASEFGNALTPAGRRRLYEAISKLDEDTHRLSLGSLDIDLARIDRDLNARLGRLESVRKWIEPGMDGLEPTIRGFDIPVYMVAALGRGQTIEEILEDYPSLSRELVEAAIDYAKAYPKRGRPYPPRSLKRAIQDLATLGAFDEDDGERDGTPREIR